MGLVLQSGFGFAVIGALAWALSEQRWRVPWRIVAGGVLLQIALALVLLKLPLVRDLFAAMNEALLALERATRAGTSFVFG